MLVFFLNITTHLLFFRGYCLESRNFFKKKVRSSDLTRFGIKESGLVLNNASRMDYAKEKKQNEWSFNSQEL